MKIGIGIPNQVRNMRPDVVPSWAKLAEESGFAALTTVGSQAYPGLSDTVALAAAAAVTCRVELISSVLLAATWPAPLLAKELAGIDAISGGRLTLGLSVGQRPDDFIAEGCGFTGRGARMDRDLGTYRSVWRGGPVGGGPNPAVSQGTRQIPMWQRAGREGLPRLVALAYVALGDRDKGRQNVYDFYRVVSGEFAGIVAGAVCDSPAKVKERISSSADIGIDEISFNPATDDVDEIKRLADIVF